ncbi:MAG: two pore domain potassium channel family protein [Parachlamydiaceae bacterium]|nr:two pore domain potassium channel family protein [Parachlamydiaceae bacterium]
MTTKTQPYLLNDKWRFAGFLGAFFAIISIFFVIPLLEKNFYTHLILQSSFTLLILSTIYTVEKQQTILISGFFFLTPFIYFDALGFHYHSMIYMALAHLFSSIFTLVAIIILMRKILHASKVNAELIFGAMMVYLLSGILWANFYFIEDIICPGCFNGVGILNFDNTNFLSIYEQQFNFLYYSFATLATLGMGDITPLSHLAKSLTAMEAMFGQLFVAIIIAKLVSVWWSVPTTK